MPAYLNNNFDFMQDTGKYVKFTHLFGSLPTHQGVEVVRLEGLMILVEGVVAEVPFQA